MVASSVAAMSEERRISMHSGGHFNAASLLLAPSVSDGNPNASTSAAPACEDPATAAPIDWDFSKDPANKQLSYLLAPSQDGACSDVPTPTPAPLDSQDFASRKEPPAAEKTPGPAGPPEELLPMPNIGSFEAAPAPAPASTAPAPAGAAPARTPPAPAPAPAPPAPEAVPPIRALARPPPLTVKAPPAQAAQTPEAVPPIPAPAPSVSDVNPNASSSAAPAASAAPAREDPAPAPANQQEPAASAAKAPPTEPPDWRVLLGDDRSQRRRGKAVAALAVPPPPEEAAAKPSGPRPGPPSAAAAPARPAHSDSDAAPAANFELALAAPITYTIESFYRTGSSALAPEAVPAIPQHSLIQLATQKDVLGHILHPLRRAIRGVFPEWNLPVRLNINGTHKPLHCLHEVFVLDYESVIGPALLNLQVQEWKPQFYEEEPDPTPRYARDTPRLDILITFTDGTWLRWHPDANLIWSTTPQPTDAMRQRMNRKKIF